ncbi:MAG: SdrD B-like domain-containing protein, partial [Pirellulales bacterium]
FNFRGKNGAVVEADGDAGTTTKDAIRLFQAAKQDDGRGDPAVASFFVDGRVDVDLFTNRWLNSPLAPFWGEVRDALRNRIAVQEGEDETFATSWTLETIERAVAARPELLRIGSAEELGLHNLSEYPDNGPTVHPSPAHKAGMSIDWDVEEDALVTGVDPIDFNDPFDLNQPAITDSERAVILDILAFVGAAESVGAGIEGVSIGGTGGQPSYQRIRDVLTHVGVPNVQPASTHHRIFSVNLLPPQGEFQLPNNVQTALLDVLEALQENGAAALLSQPLMQTVLPLVNVTVAESLDLEQAFQLALVQPVQQMLAGNTAPRIHDLQNALQGLVINRDNLLVELSDVRIDRDGSDAPGALTVALTLRALQVNDIDLGGDLPQNNDGGPQDVLDPQAAATNFAVDLTLPLEIRIPVSVADPETEVVVTPGEIAIEVASVSIRDFDASIGVMPVTIDRGPVVLGGSLTMNFTETDAEGRITLAQLNDPFLNDAIAVTPGPSEVAGILPVQHTICNFLDLGDQPQLTISSLDIFNGLPATVTPNADFEPLLVFQSLTNVDLLGFLNSLSTTLNRLSEALDLPEGIPFVSSALSSLLDLGSIIDDVVAKLTQGTEVFFEDFQGLLDVLKETLGITAEQLNLRCDPATNAVLMDLDFTRNFTLPVPLDFGASLGPIDVSAGAMAELSANVELDLTIGFDFNASDVTEAELLATPLAELNGNTGVGTVAGDDIEIVLPTGSFTITDELGGPFTFKEEIEIQEEIDNATPRPTDRFKAELDQFILSDDLKQKFADAGHALSGGVDPDADLKAIRFGERWRLRDGNAIYEIVANGDVMMDVTVSSITPIDVDSIGAGATVNDALDLITTSTGGAVTFDVITENDFNPDLATNFATSLRFTYGAMPGGVEPTFAIRAANSSPAVGDLGFAGTDTGGDGSIIGTINTRDQTDRFFVTEESRLAISGGLTADAMELSVAFGGLGLAIQNGDFSIAIGTALSLVDPGTGVNDDGRLTLSEIFDTSIIDLVDLQTPTLIGSGRLPIVGQGEIAGIDANVLLNINPNHPFTEAFIPELSEPVSDGPEILIDIRSNPLDVTITTNEQFDEIIDGFQFFSADSICDAVEQVINLLRSSDLEIFNTEIPLINRSVNDLLQPDSLLQTVIDVLCVDFDDLRAELETLVDEQLDQATEPVGAIPAIFGDLNAEQQTELSGLRDALRFALGQTDLERIPTLVAGVVIGFRSFIDSLPGSVDTNQLSAIVDQIDTLLPSTDGLEATVEDALGLGPDDFTIEFQDADEDPMTPGLLAIARLTLPVSYTEQIPLDFDFDSLPVQIDTGGEFDVNLTGKLQLDFGVDLSDGVPLADRLFLVGFDDGGTPNDASDDTGTRAEIGVGIEATGLMLGVTVGGIGGADVVQNGHVELKRLEEATATGDGSDTLTLNASVPASVRDVAFVEVDGTMLESDEFEFVAGNMVNFTPSVANGAAVRVFFPDDDGSEEEAIVGFRVVDEVDDGDSFNAIPFTDLFGSGASIEPVVDAMFGVNLPFDLPLIDPFPVRAFVNLGNLGDPNSLFFEFPTELTSSLESLDGEDCNVPQMVQAAQALLDVIDSALRGEILAQLPLIGDLSDEDSFFADFRDVLDLALLALEDTNSLRNFLFEQLGAPGLDILRDDQGGSVDSLAEIGDFTNPAIGNNAILPTEGSLCGQVQLRIGDRIEIPIDFDLGLDGLAFKVEANGGLNFVLDYDIELGFGIDKAEGAFIVLNEDATDPEIELEAGVFLQTEPDPGTELKLELFFLQATARQNPDGPLTGLSGEIDINLNGPSDPGKLFFSEVTSTPFDEMTDIALNINADINLELETGTTNPDLPSLKADFVVDWDFVADFGADDPFMGTLNEVSFGNFTIDLGEFVGKALKPIVTRIDEVLAPLDPLFELLDLEVPLISQISEALGGDKITLLESMIQIFGDGAESAVEFIDTVILIRQIVKDLASTPGDSFEFPLGTLDVLATGSDPRMQDADINPGENPGAVSGSGDFDSTIDGAKGDDSGEGFFAGIFDSLREIGVAFPILENPAMAFNLLFGQPVDLVRYDTLGFDPEDRLEAGFDWSITFGPSLAGPVPLAAEIFAGFSIFADLEVGIDTFGLQTTGNFLDGFFFDDTSPVFGVAAEFGASAEITLALIWAGLTGGVGAEIGASWNDINDDGKFYLQELEQRLGQGVECVFDLQGKFDAFVEFYAGLGIKIFGAKITIFELTVELLRVTLFEFEVGCPALPPPELGRMVGTELVLNIGPDASLRQAGATDGDDVVKIEFDQASGMYVVSGFNHIQEFPGVTSILVRAGDGADEITFDGSVAVPVTMEGGDGDDILIGGQGPNTIRGGKGNDRITGGKLADDLFGDEGDDVITGKDGDDTIEGGDGSDRIRGEGGNDTINGGEGDDDLSGGGGADTLRGEGGNDRLSGGGDGDDPNPLLDGGDGDDSIQGGSAADTIEGGAGADIINAGAGDDTIDGGSGDDIILADDGADAITGGDGNDKMEGGKGDDVFFFAEVLGGSETDTVKDISNSSGGGVDRLDFNMLAADDPVTVNLTNGRVRHTNRRVDVQDPANFEDATGGAGDDVFHDNRNNNVFTGNGGSDRYVFNAALGLNSASHTDTVVEQNGGGLHDEINFADLPASDSLTADVSAAETLLGGVTIAVHTTRTVVTGANGQRAFIEDITGGAAADVIYGNDADNRLVGNAGDDTIVGDLGADEIHGNAGADTISGSAGADLIFGGSGPDTIDGNSGGDEIHAGGGVDFVQGNAGADTIFGDGGDDDLLGNGGGDTIFGGTGNDFIFGGTGNDTIEGNQGADTVFGEDGNDTIDGNAGIDRLFGQQGDDTIDGGPNRDFILGDVGNDTLRGGSADDFLSGGADTGIEPFNFGDRVSGGADHDMVIGGLPVGYAALDGLVGTLFIDLFKEGAASPRPMIFSPQDSPLDFVAFLANGQFEYELPNLDILSLAFNTGGTDQDDLLHGDAGNDLLVGEDGTDYLFGDWGNDVMFAYRISAALNDLPDTNDRLEGGPDNDSPICGTNGANLLIGGTSDVNLDYTLENQPFVSPTSGGYVFNNCFDETPELLDNLPVEISGQKFRDINGDGIRNDDEHGLDGWTIELRDLEGDLLATTETASIDLNEDGAIDPRTESGLYAFTDLTVGGNVEGLEAGVYLVSEVLQPGWQRTFPLAGDQVTLESGDAAVANEEMFDGNTVVAYSIALDSGLFPEDVEVATNIDFANVELSEISGVKWHDLDGDAIQDPDEPVRPMWTIELERTADAVVIDTVQTNENGIYRFTDVPAGDYRVREILPGAWQATTPSFYDVTVGFAETIADLNFGNKLPAQISGTKWRDNNANGIRDVGDDGIDGAELSSAIYLDLNFNRQFDLGDDPFVFPDANGNFTFSDLDPGIYVVAEVVNEAGGWIQSSPGPADLGLHMFEVQSGDIITGADFGNYQTGSIRARKLNDENGDGVLFPFQPLSGFEIYLDLNDNGQLDDGEPVEVTGADGRVEFTDLTPGTYVVAEVEQSGFVPTFPAPDPDTSRRTHTVVLNSGQSPVRLFGNAPSMEIHGIKWHDLN